MQNLQQNNEIEPINKEINLLQDLRKTKKKLISEWVNENQKNTCKKRIKYGSFSNQKNTKYS